MYLMTVSTLSFDESLTVVQHCRQMANPNMGFRAQLVRYQEEKLLAVRRIEGVPRVIRKQLTCWGVQV